VSTATRVFLGSDPTVRVDAGWDRDLPSLVVDGVTFQVDSSAGSGKVLAAVAAWHNEVVKQEAEVASRPARALVLAGEPT